MSQPPTARASAWRFAFSLEGLRGKEVRRAAITCSIFTLDPPGANAHSNRTLEQLRIRRIQVPPPHATTKCISKQKFFAPHNGALLGLVHPRGEPGRGARFYPGSCTFTFTSILALAVTCTTSPPAKYFSSTPGVNHSSSHPFSIATTVYLPGCTPGSANDPSESLWSRRKSTRLSSGTSGTSTIMTPSTGLPSFTAKPVTRPVPSDSTILSLTSCPPVISTLRPLALAPVADKLLTATVADWINTSYVPGGTA